MIILSKRVIFLFSFGIQKEGRCMIADDMGLGKTYQAIAIADYYKDDWPVLICTTASTRYYKKIK